MSTDACELCTTACGEVLWQDADCRVIKVDDPGYPGFCRVVWNEHVAEMSDLSDEQRTRLMHVVWATERVIRELMQPKKINLASLGNVVPHLHWHVIPRFADDPHFPQPVWSSALRTGAVRDAPASETLAAALAAALSLV
ncbi:hypothetical protein GCM10025771_05960 [Niveibacterium umoris]|uniref:Diadenosine tetraphosphate (Ap4A) HIT family hydrolase n=1 Tax=Niveibacterium umoris TaxID=1193620 RepID=A0A840BSR1_9RHOO|nr:HIT family protein [Niveibacterium umoris]MBB4013856.1 diadenosine tetraphosphate (Ap4A) HIT family hydrolase [Niveibacterium umoris]